MTTKDIIDVVVSEGFITLRFTTQSLMQTAIFTRVDLPSQKTQQYNGGVVNEQHLDKNGRTIFGKGLTVITRQKTAIRKTGRKSFLKMNVLL